MKNHMPSSLKKFNGLSTHFISRNVGTYFLLNVHNALLNVRYIVFTRTKRYQCAFVCTPIFCIITLSHYLRKIEYVVHSRILAKYTSNLESPLPALHKNSSFLNNVLLSKPSSQRYFGSLVRSFPIWILVYQSLLIPVGDMTIIFSRVQTKMRVLSVEESSAELYRNKLHNMKRESPHFFSHLSKEKLRQQDTPQEIQNDEVSGTT